MFCMPIMGSDDFLDMPLSSQALYVHLGMRADDDGFVSSPKSIVRMIGSTEEDFKNLIEKKFIIPFEGVIAIKHWHMNNYIRKDRYHPSVYAEERSKLYIKQNRAYTLDPAQGVQYVTHLATVGLAGGTPTDTDCPSSGIPSGIPSGTPDGIPSGNQRLTENRIDKNSIDKSNSVDKNNTVNSADKPTGDWLSALDEAVEKPKQTKQNLQSVLKERGIDGELLAVMNNFIAMRKTKKRPLTERALKMVLNELDKLSSDEDTRVRIVEQSVLHCWDTVYPLKTEQAWKPINNVGDVAKIPHRSNPFAEMAKGGDGA